MNKILIGFSAGILVGILFAPSKGEKTRRRIMRKGRNLKHKFNDMVDTMTDKFERVADSAADLTESKQSLQPYQTMG